MNTKKKRRILTSRWELKDLYRPPVPQEGRYGRLRLDKNEHTAGWPDGIVQKMISAISGEVLAAYPEPRPFYEALAHLHGVKTENILVTAGSEIAIRYIFEAYLERGEDVVFLEPSFAMFDVYATLCGARRIKVPCGNNLQFSVDPLLAALSVRTKIVALANPNNPTGTVFKPTDLVRVAKKTASLGALLLVDEAYYDFYGKTALDFLSDFDNLIVTRTFSKAWGLAGVRLGYAVAHRSVIDVVRKVQPIDHANALALRFGEYMLKHPSLVQRYVQSVAKGKIMMTRAAERLGIKVWPSHANFLVMNVGDRRDRFIEEAKKRGVLIASQLRLPFSEEFVRLTVGPPGQMRRVVKILQGVFR